MPTTIARLARLLAVLLALAVVAAACGNDDDGGAEAPAADTTDAEAEPEATEAEPEATEEEEVAAEATPESEDDPIGGADDAAMTPEYGGELVVLLEAETNTWDIPGSNCAASCISVMRQVADPLMIAKDDGTIVPFLLESFEANEDFTEFTLTMRDGITFHNGSPADGAAVLRNIEEMAAGTLQGQVLRDLESAELVDDLTVRLTFSIPFATLADNLAERTGWLLAPEFWDDPDLRANQPIGTGPFVWDEWVPNESLRVVKNDDYWRADAEGNALPYLDSILFRPIPDVSARQAAMESGDADVNHDSFAENNEFWNVDWVEGGGNLLTGGENETTYLLLNNAAPPFDDPQVRQALALCTDRDQYLQLREPDTEKANGPFSPEALGFLDDSGFPDLDPDAGRALLEEIGFDQTIVYGTTNVPSNLVTAQLFADQWANNCGLDVEIEQVDQAEIITKAILGDFQVLLWRNHGQGNPGNEFVWWHSRHAEGLALNFGRIADDGIDETLMAIRGTADQDELDTLAQDLNRLFAENVNNLWLNWTEWQMPYQGDVHGVGLIDTPDGGVANPTVAGRLWLQQAWMEQ